MQASIEELRTQLLQLKQLHDSGALPGPEYDSSKAKLEKRIVDLVLSDSVTAPSQALPPAAPAPRPSRALVLPVAAFVLVVAFFGYRATGSPSLAGWGEPPPAAATAADGASGHSVSAAQITEMAERLAARLKEQPQDPQGWAMLGRSYSVLGRNDDAVKAYATAIAQQGDDAVLIADYADALAVQNNRTLAGEPMKWVKRALELDPANVKALALAGTDAFDRKDYAGAVRYWEDLLKVAPSEGGFAGQVRASVAEARQLGGLPAAAPPGAAAMAPARAVNASGAKPAAAAPATANAQAAAAGSPAASVSGTVRLNPALAAQAGPDDTVFIFARAAEGARIPLAVLRKQVRELPASFTLDDSLAMSPAAKLSSATRLIVGARISRSGNAMPSPGDLTGQVGPVELGSRDLMIEIREQIKP
jgi:cytochrome c-type biogenesis protein CcmH